MTKYIFVAGGVMSGIGKGVTVSSIGRILKSKGFNVQAVKIDPYINVDAGTMNPIEHGEVFVTEDGTECDQDIGNYERFLDKNLNTENYLTTGRVYQTVIGRERNLGYNGKCVEVIPHIPQEVILRLNKVAKKSNADFCLVEIGGTVGEYQNLVFLEAARMLRLRHPKDVVFVLVSYLPVPEMIGEMKTKPTQYAVRSLNMAGIQPDIIIARSRYPLDKIRKEKISTFCNVSEKDVISAPDISSIYEIPINFEKDNLGNRILKKVGLKGRQSKLGDWQKLVKTIHSRRQKVIKIGIVGKYFKTGNFTLLDSYVSVIEAIKHACYSFNFKPEIVWLNSEEYEKNPKKILELKQFDGIIVPGGFGKRGVEGKIKAIKFVREHKIPFLGLCFGMQLAVIEFARNVCKLKNATSSEFYITQGKGGQLDKLKSLKNKTIEPVIDIMASQKEKIKMGKYGGTMRLGAYQCKLENKSLAKKAYKQSVVYERHRHRYELNNLYRQVLEDKGMKMSGINPETNLVEIIEVKNHPFFLASQFHPEFKSRPLSPHPLFKEFIKACSKKKQKEK